MIVYKITNTTRSSIYIEDLGLRLSPGDSSIISSDSYSRSEDLKRNENLFRSEMIIHKNPSNFRPVHPIQEPKKDPPRSEVPDNISNKLDMIYDMVHKLMRDNVNISNEIKKKIEEIPSPTVVPFRPGMIHHHEFEKVPEKDIPMYIPSKVIPEATIQGNKPQEKDVEFDVDSSLESLKKARKK